MIKINLIIKPLKVHGVLVMIACLISFLIRRTEKNYWHHCLDKTGHRNLISLKFMTGFSNRASWIVWRWNAFNYRWQTRRSPYIDIVCFFAQHYIDVTWVSWRFKSPANRLFIWQLVQARSTKKHQRSAFLALCEENPPVNSTHKGQWCGKRIHIMTSSWN